MTPFWKPDINRRRFILRERFMLIRLLIVLLTILSGISVLDRGQDQPEKAEPFEIVPKKLEFGRIFDGDNPIKTVKFRNKDEKSISINDITSSCGCATPRIRLPGGQIIELEGRVKRTTIGQLKPGEEAELEVCFTTWGYKGKLNKSISIHTDHAKRPRAEISVTAEIIDSVAYEPEVLDLGIVIRGQKKSGSIKMKSVGIGDFEITGFKNKGLFPNLEFKAKKLKAGENAEAIVEVSVKGEPKMGKWKGEVIMALRNEYVQEARMSVMAEVVPKIRFKLGNEFLGDQLDLGVFSAREGKSLSVDIINLVPEIPYEPLGINVEEGKLEARLETVKDQERYRLHVKTKTGAEGAGFLRGRIHIPSHHPDLYLKTLHVVGWTDPETDG